jgi:hypothetical protein
MSLVESPPSIYSNLGATKYLHLAIQLFFASSGTYDPLIKNPATSAQARIDRYRIAQLVVKRADWGLSRIRSSTDYLMQLFEIEIQVLNEPGLVGYILKKPVSWPAPKKRKGNLRIAACSETSCEFRGRPCELKYSSNVH